MAGGDIVCFGECMVELSRTEMADRWHSGFAGDTANVAVYCARSGHSTKYMTAIGTDPFSEEMRSFLLHEDVDTDLILTDPERVPGLYAIRTDEHGERSFTYWRDNSAARHFFQAEGLDTALAAAAKARLLYLSGITLSLFPEAGQARIAELARKVRTNGGIVAFDGNYRARGWQSAEVARKAFASFAPHCSVILPTFEDEEALFGDASQEDSLARWHQWGAEVVALKLGPDGALVSHPGGTSHIPSERPRRPVDTTGAGDSFNAAFLAAFLDRADPIAAARAGNRLAGEVVMHRGAIIPREAMPATAAAA